jgi:hypothetical protein
MPYSLGSAISDEFTLEGKSLTKHALYSFLLGLGGAATIGGLSFSDTTQIGSMNVSAPVGVAAAISIASTVAMASSDIILKTTMDTSSKNRDMEKTAISTLVAGGGAVLGMKQFAGIDPSLNGFILGAATNGISMFVQNEYDAKLLGMLW